MNQETPSRVINQIEPVIGQEEKKAVIDYLNSGGWLTEFQKTRQFEEMIAHYLGCKYACVVNNGTSALMAALMALGIGHGEEVIVPDFTIIVDANVPLVCGAKPVLVDIERTNLCLSLESIKRSISPKTAAVILVSINGRSPDVESILDFAQQGGIHVIEDAAQSLGSKRNGKYLGTFGEVGCFSFSMPKIITTGQGGAVVTNDEELYDKIRRIKDFGRPRSGVDYHDIIGYNFKFTDLLAVIGMEQLKKIDRNLAKKKSMFSLYRELLKDSPVKFLATDLSDVAPWYMDILLPSPAIRTRLASHLENRGIKTRPFYPAIHTQPPYSHIDEEFPASTWASTCGLWLPSSLSLQESDIQHICTVAEDFLGKFP